MSTSTRRSVPLVPKATSPVTPKQKPAGRRRRDASDHGNPANASEARPPLNDRDAAEHLARCVATMVYCQADGWSWSAAQLLWEQSRSLLAWASASCATGELDTFVLAPLSSELSARFGPHLGMKLHREFLRALRDASET